ncbi:MAG: type II/IV secretion system ATPase subunit [Nanoarchaeota archaeon]|nr:type II/IV secretion system ATPase subunit [Nanoarchaeota archaeon]
MTTKEEGMYQIVRDGDEEVLKVNADSWPYTPSLEDKFSVMADVVDKLVASPSVKRVIFHQRKKFVYSYDQVQMLIEIANIYTHLIKGKKVLSISGWGFDEVSARFYGDKMGEIQYLVLNLLRGDPLGAFVESKRILREERILIKRDVDERVAQARSNYILLLSEIVDLLEKTKIVQILKNSIDGFHIGDRKPYREVFRAAVTPDFIYTRLRSNPPLDGEELDFYKVGDSEVSIFRMPGDIKTYYHSVPIEFKLNEDEYELLDIAKNVLAGHKPRNEEFMNPDKMRATFYNIGKDLLGELAKNKGYDISYERIGELAKILVRYTVGFGLIEILLADQNVQDVTINSPVGESPMYLVHQEYGECYTNIVPSYDDAESWATKFRLISGRPLDEANPVLDTELNVPGGRSRVAVMTRPLSPKGLAFAMRRHRDRPWTLPLFINNRMISPLGAGLVSFLIDGARTMLVAGTRSSGKTSLLGSFMVDIMRKYRIITIEDTLELPVKYLRQLGYNIQNMKVRSALTTGGSEMSADDGIRTSLRLGDSSLIIGEVRSVEAKALYEAMRTGALANVVAGTIHGADPYGVYDRVVNDLNVPKTSFKATDIITVANPVKSADGINSWKRVLQITEVRKHWSDDPLRERGFVDLLKYDAKRDELLPTADLLNGESEVVKAVAGNVREWAGNWDAVWENILLRSRMKQVLVEYSNKTGNMELLESNFVVASNDVFHRLIEQIKGEVGSIDNKRIFFEWNEWVKKNIKFAKNKT